MENFQKLKHFKLNAVKIKNIKAFQISVISEQSKKFSIQNHIRAYSKIKAFLSKKENQKKICRIFFSHGFLN